MKKKDIIQLVKEAIKETTFYGNRHQRSSISGLPGVMEEETFDAKDEYETYLNTKEKKQVIAFAGGREEDEAVMDYDELKAKLGIKFDNAIKDYVMENLNEAGPSNNPYYNAIEAKAKKMKIHVNDYIKDLLKDKSEMEIVKMGYQDLAALAGVENLDEFQQPKTFDSDTIRLVREMLEAASIHHNELVDDADTKKISSFLDERSGGTYIKFPHYNGPQGRGAMFGKETTDQIERSKAAAKAAALKTYTQFKDYIEDEEISFASPTGVYGNVYLFVMFNDLAKDYTSPKGGTQSSQFEMHDFEKKYGDKIKPDNFKNNEKLQPGKKVTYLGTSRTIVKNNGFILTLDNGTTVNLGQFNQKGAIKEKDMKRKNIKEVKFAGPNASIDMQKHPDFQKLQGDEKEDAKKDLKMGKSVNLEEDEMDEMNYKDSGLENPKAADISKDGEISDYEQKRGLAIQNAMKDQEKNEMYTNDIGKDDYVDDEGRMAKSQMYKTGKYAMKLHDMLDDMEQLPAWVQAKLTKASDYLSAVYHYLDYEFVRRDSNLMEHVDKHKKRSMLMEGAMKKFFEMFDKGKTDEEIVQDYAQKGTQVPEPFVKRARNQYEGMKKLKLELEMSEKEFRNSSEKMVNNAEEGMESPMEEKQLASRLK